MAIPLKPFWPTLAQSIYKTCQFITRHQSVLISVVREVSPTDLAAVETAFAAINTACALFTEVMTHVDPNWKPN